MKIERRQSVQPPEAAQSENPAALQSAPRSEAEASDAYVTASKAKGRSQSPEQAAKQIDSVKESRRKKLTKKAPKKKDPVDRKDPVETKPTRDKENAKFKAELEKTVDGLLFTSESDYPLDYFFKDAAAKEPVTPQKFLELAGKPADTPIETRDFKDYFQRLTTVHDPDDPAAVESAKRYGELQKVLEKNLTDLQVFRTGEIQIGVFFVGKNSYGDLVGLSTTSIET